MRCDALQTVLLEVSDDSCSQSANEQSNTTTSLPQHYFDKQVEWATTCGCATPITTNPCHFCDWDDMTRPDHVPYHLAHRWPLQFDGLTCRQLFDFVPQVTDADGARCYLAKETNYQCGCNNGFWGYLGSDTVRQQRISVWLGRTTGTLGLGGALYILWDCYRYARRQQTRRASSFNHNLYRQMMVLVAFFDAITGIIWILGSAVLPTTLPNGDVLPAYGSLGNEMTCQVAGFVYQLGYGSIYVSVALTFYYYLVIVRNWKTPDLLKARKWLIGLPVVCAVVVATLAWPYYGPMGAGCTILPEPFQDDMYLNVYSVFPLLLTVLTATVLQVLIFCKVRRQVTQSMKWRFPTNQPQRAASSGRRSSSFLFRHETEVAVFWQSLSYLTTFYVCWFLVAIFLVGFQKGYGPWILFYILAPMPGFFNCLIFVRSRNAFLKTTNRRSSRLGRSSNANVSSDVTPTQWFATGNQAIEGRNNAIDRRAVDGNAALAYVAAGNGPALRPGLSGRTPVRRLRNLLHHSSATPFVLRTGMESLQRTGQREGTVLRPLR